MVATQAMAVAQTMVVAQMEMVVIAAMVMAMLLPALPETLTVQMPRPALNWKARIPLHSHHQA